MKAPVILTVILIMSLAAWAFFYLVGLPLSPMETVVVVGLCALAAWLVKVAVISLQKRRAARRRKRAKVKRNVENP